MAERPNILLFMSDQHNPHVLGAAGDRITLTPNLDRLAAQGTRFKHAYCASPLCVPSRMTFLTSRHCSEIQVWTNECFLASDIPTFAHMLGTAGYETVLCGRMHFVGTDHRHGFEHRLVGDVSPQWHGTCGPRLDPIPEATTGQSWKTHQAVGAGRSAYQAFDRAVIDGAIDYLHKYATGPRTRPFCLVVGGVLPHCPFICPGNLFDYYLGRVEVPDVPAAELEELHPAMRLWREIRGLEQITLEQARAARAAYCGLVTLLDQWLGELFQTVHDVGLSGETAVFYTSDHGDMAGEHGMWWKNSFYAGSAGVPLIASWPGRFAAGREVAEPVSLLDLGPTLTELGEATSLPEAAGHSLLPFLSVKATPSSPERDIMAENVGRQEELPSRMLLRWPWKLIHYHRHDQPQLFNLERDPGETHDLRADPYCATVRDELRARAREGWDGDGIMRILAHRRPLHEAITRWAHRMNPPDPDHWLEPEGCNVFPEASASATS